MTVSGNNTKGATDQLMGRTTLVETPSYEVLKKLEDVEIRKYPPILLVTSKGDYDLFNSLFQYISGANKGSSKISMTAPVITP